MWTGNSTWPRVPRRIVQAWIALELGVLAMQPIRSLISAEHTDYVAFATGGRLAGTDCMYCPLTQYRVEAGVVGHAPPDGLNGFVNPPLTAYLLRPIADLTLRPGLAVFLALSAMAVALAALLLWRHTVRWGVGHAEPVALSAVALVPGAATFAYANWDGLLLLAGALALLAMMKRADLWAGLILSLLLVKPQLVWLVVPALLITRRYRMVLGFGVGAAIWLATTVAILGPGGTRQYLALVRAIDGGEQFAKTVGLPALAGGLGLGAGSVLALSAAIVVTVTMWRHRVALRQRPELALGAGLSASLLCSPHVYADDLLLLAIPLVILGCRAPGLAVVATMGIGVIGLIEPSLPDALHVVWALATGALLASQLNTIGFRADETRQSPIGASS